MSKYIGPKLKLSRTEGVDLGHKSGVRDIKSKCNLEVRPGMHGANRTRRTDFANQMREKQKVKRIYGLRERQFKNYYKKATQRQGSTSDNLITMLESRLDNLVYRAGFASTRSEARQLVSHKGVSVNGNVVNVPSYVVSPTQVIAIREKAKNQDRIKFAVELSQARPDADWLAVDHKTLTAEFKQKPDIDTVSAGINLQLIIELYSK
jgi:small subunit ribosomal protein S4